MKDETNNHDRREEVGYLWRNLEGQSRQRHRRSLTDDQVREVRQLYATGEWSLCKLAERHNVNVNCINQIIKRLTYQDVD